MGNTAIDMRITRDVSLSDIPWSDLLYSSDTVDTLEKGSGSRFRQLKIYQRFNHPFDLTWFIRRGLSPLENEVMVKVCSYYGADSIYINSRRQVGPEKYGLDCRLRVLVQPRFRRESSRTQGRINPELEIRWAGYKLNISSFWPLFAVNLVIFSAALIFYLLLVGLLVYGLAVSIVLVRDPAHLLTLLFKNQAVGLAVLGYLLLLTILVRQSVLGLLRYRRRQRDKAG